MTNPENTKAPALAGVSGAIEPNQSRKRKETVNLSIPHPAKNFEGVTEWWQQVRADAQTHGAPINDLSDLRAKIMLDNPVHHPSRHLLGTAALKDIIATDPESAGELYFNKYYEKPEPPIATPAWATTKKVLWGSFPEVEIEFTTSPIEVENYTVRWSQFMSIQGENDCTRELLEEPIVHVSRPELLVYDGRTNFVIDGGVDVVSMLSAALDDAAREFHRSSSRELLRLTEPGSPAFEEGI